MKKNGFTLIELLGALIILAIIALIAFPNILNVIKKTDEKIDNETKSVVETAACEYVNDNKNLFSFTKCTLSDLSDSSDSNPTCVSNATSTKKTVTKADLCDNGYLEDKICSDLASNTEISIRLKGTKVDSDVVGSKIYYKYDCCYKRDCSY